MADDVAALLVTSVLMIVVSTLSVAMRLYVRAGILGGLGWDDVLIVISWVFAMALYAATLAARNYGFGQHMDVVPTEQLSTFSRLIMVCSTTYSWGVPAAKASFAVLYLRILQGHGLALLNKFLIVFLLCQAIEETLVVVLQCRPVAKAWDSSLEGHCISLVPMWWCTFVFNLFTDLALFIQPIPTMWHLQLPLTKRIGVIAMLSLGLLVCVISVIRIVFVTKIGPDSTYELAEPMVWSQVEITALILCSCIPSLRQVIQKIPWLNRLVGLSSAKDSANPYYAGGPRTGSKNPKSSGVNGASIALHSRGQYDDPFGPVRSHTKSHLKGNGNFGNTSRVERDAIGRPPSQDGSTDEIFPSYRQQQNQSQGGVTPIGGAGAILVTRELNIKHDDQSENSIAMGGGGHGHGNDGRHVFSDPDLNDGAGRHNMAKASASSLSSTSLTDDVPSPKRK